MAKRIATQLAEEIQGRIEDDRELGNNATVVFVATLQRWLRWAKQLDARTRYDGSKASKHKRAKK